MRSNTFSYALRNLPAQVVTSYLAQYYHWESDNLLEDPLNLYVGYYDGPTPKKYKTLLSHYPGRCLNQKAHITDSRFILAISSDIMNRTSDISSLFLDEQLFKDSTNHNRYAEFQIRDQIWSAKDPKIVGILNITPDSFYDGGSHTPKCNFKLLAEKMIDEGADLIDIGGESTRPGSHSIDIQEEISRIGRAVSSIRSKYNIPISIDTTKAEVADVMLQLGADMINDVSALSEGDKMIEVVNKHKASCCLMHTNGPPETMQKQPVYEDLIAEIYFFFKQMIERCNDSGIPPNKILIDPGIGFGKTAEQNLDILRLMSVFTKLSSSIMLGTSNKSFIGTFLDAKLENRIAGTVATQVLGFTNGASFFRVHNIKENKDAISITKKYFPN
ncbi:MAG: dihydropteroate synthase [Proteobacteria bacterium]|nr:dihydropteroate synthase [Pseudomonadota bacterium]